MLPNVEAAKKLPFEIGDGKGNYRKATPEEIESAFSRVDSIQQPSNSKDAYTANAFDPKNSQFAKDNNLDDLRLSSEARERLLDEALKEHVNIVRWKFKKKGDDFDSFPSSAQKVLLDIQFNTGLNLDKSWKELQTAIKNRDWVKASEEVNRSQPSKERNDWAKKEMLKAQEWENKRNNR